MHSISISYIYWKIPTTFTITYPSSADHTRACVRPSPHDSFIKVPIDYNNFKTKFFSLPSSLLERGCDTRVLHTLLFVVGKPNMQKLFGSAINWVFVNFFGCDSGIDKVTSNSCSEIFFFNWITMMWFQVILLGVVLQQGEFINFIPMDIFPWFRIAQKVMWIFF